MIRKSFLIFLLFLLLNVPLAVTLADEKPTAESVITYIGVSDADGTTEIEIKSSASFKYTILRPSDPYRIIVELQDTALGEFREKVTIDKEGVLEIAPLQDEKRPNVARLEISLTIPADVEPIYKDNSLILAFDNPEFTEMDAEEEIEEDTEEESEMDFETDEVSVEAEEEGIQPSDPAVEVVRTLAAPKYTGEKIAIDFQDAELIHVFRLISDVSGYNIVVSPDVKGKFSMKLIDVPWDQALDVILRNYQLSKTIADNIIRIAPTAVFAREEEAIARAKESQEKSGDLLTRIYPINYADVTSIKQSILDAKILTKRGFISVDTRTTAIIIKDVENKHFEYEHIIDALDIATPQVSIDARIVEVTTGFTRELGIQWGALVKPTPQTLVGGTGLGVDSGFFSGNPMLVNLPAAVGTGSGGSVGIGYIGAGALRSLDFQLSAMESSGKGKVVSNPRVITMDNQMALIRQGKKIPYQTISDEGTKTAFVDAALELKVTPHITPEKTILMSLEVRKNEADFSRTSGDVPTIDTKEVLTQILIKDGDTLAIGGIFKTNKTKDNANVPGLGNIPVLGWLFKTQKDIEEVSEILIFITPRIVKGIDLSE